MPMSKQKGFRLKRMEVYNWGTFNQRIYALDIEGENALLTGDIGSGKSTVVDAITTLLVPNQKITYNKAAGSLAKERTLYSYVVGEYKNTVDEGMGSSKAVALRDTKHYSVLLATFENTQNNEIVSIAQFFWLTQGSRIVNKLFVVAKRTLSIEKHFLDFASIKELKKALSSIEGVSTAKSFKDYSKTFRRLMKIQSEQALNLFYQTVSMKSVGNLTSFVRSHMLEESEIDKKIDELCENFDELNQAHDTVLRAKKQMEILSPLVADAQKYRYTLQSKKGKEKLRELLSAYFAKEKLVLLEEKLHSLDIEETKTSSKIREYSHTLEEMQEKHFELKDALKRSGGEKILSINKEILRQNHKRDSRKKVHTNYHKHSKNLGLATVSSEHTFLTNVGKVEKELLGIEDKKEAFDTEQFLQRGFLDKKKECLNILESELGFLRQRKSNIPMQNAKIRDQIKKDIGIELVFVGELLRIKDKAWEGAIERVLRPFALSLLVNERDYSKVSNYIDKTQIKGKIVYLKVSKELGKRQDKVEQNALISKLEIHHESPFYAWIEWELYRRFDYACVESLAEFRRYKKALTKNAQIKSSLVRHEKDDRFRVDDRRQYILGWENKEKILQVNKDISLLKEALIVLEKTLKALEKQGKESEILRDGLRDILHFEDFESIDWYSIAKKIDALTQEKEQLEKSSDIIKTLEASLDKLKEEIQDKNQALNRFHQKKGKIQSDIEKFSKEAYEAKELFEGQKEGLERYILDLTAYLKEKKLVKIELHTVKKDEHSIREMLQKEIDSLNAKMHRSTEKITSAMQNYIKTFPLLSKEVDASLSSIAEFEKMFVALKKDDLPKYEKRFKKLFREGTIQHFLSLKTRLEEEEKAISKKISLINASLKSIEYSTGTFIELSQSKAIDVDIREFKENLKQALSGTIGGDDSYDEGKFLQVKKIIERFNGREHFVDVDKKWRKKVVDVRNWFSFGANEKYQGDGSLKEYYSDSSGKSGGQKEKLAYTVLASSIAFAYGLEDNANKSFRFVMIDEAFGKGSDDSTKYGLELFQKLNLQLLVITPIQKINVIEPYIASIHFVHNHEGMDSSVVGLSVEEYLEGKR
ncbi:FIG007317: Chromosome segregation protein SMC-like [hydrothermal vent metagenome]|uniref:FIG007317: Chromosome segregation protein SMC-like n=1 Tax=hydrothermal vent metagenome TaxID=652676 RepID=A0A1W1BL75_9ZZZZ